MDNKCWINLPDHFTFINLSDIVSAVAWLVFGVLVFCAIAYSVTHLPPTNEG